MEATYSSNSCAEILPHLYLSSIAPAENFDFLKAHKIKHIVNSTGYLHQQNGTERYPNCFPKDFNYFRLIVSDELGTNISNQFEKVGSFISSAVNKNENILVHCEAGISRSSTLVIAFLMKEAGMSLKEAYTHVQQKKSNIGPNSDFFSQLIDYEKKIKKIETPTISLEDYLVDQLLKGPAQGIEENKLRNLLKTYANDTHKVINALWDF